MNNISLIGNISRDIELKQAGDTAVVNFSVAVQREYKNKDGEYEVDFINCKAFKEKAEFISKYFSKGSKIGIIGSLQIRSYETDTGEKRTVAEVLVNKTDFCGVKKETQSSVELTPVDDDDLPF